MIVLYILLGLVALVTAVLLMPIRLTLRTDENGELYTSWYLLGILLSEDREGPEPFKASRYTKRAVLRRQRIALRRRQNARAKARMRAEGKKITIDQPLLSYSDIPITDQLHYLADLLVLLFRHTLRRARVDVQTLAVTVATDDAAKTAMLYGGCCAALAGVTEALNAFTNLHIHHPERYGVAADFLGEQTKLDVHLSLRLPLGSALALEARLLFGIFSREMQKIENKQNLK